MSVDYKKKAQEHYELFEKYTELDRMQRGNEMVDSYSNGVLVTRHSIGEDIIAFNAVLAEFAKEELQKRGRHSSFYCGNAGYGIQYSTNCVICRINNNCDIREELVAQIVIVDGSGRDSDRVKDIYACIECPLEGYPKKVNTRKQPKIVLRCD